jgi:uncharacterized membrane protein
MRMAEAEAEHRRTQEAAIVQTRIRESVEESAAARRGQFLAAIITLAAIAAGTYTALNGHELAGTVIGVGGISSIVTTFIVGRASNRRVSQDSEQPVMQEATSDINFGE